MRSFDHFIAIDWSGAKAGYAKKLAVAQCDAGQEAPRLIVHPDGWTRRRIADYVIDQPPGTLIGFDFSFAPPFLDQGAYLPGDDVPTQGPGFWAYVDRLSGDDPDMGAHSFIAGQHRPSFYLGKVDGKKADYMRWRVCEAAFNARGGGKAACVFDAIGAAQVSKASFAGMRVLHHISSHVDIWPFNALSGDRAAVTEIYCRAFIQHAGLRGLKVRDKATLNKALAGLHSLPYARVFDLSDDQTDVLIASAGLRALAQSGAAWAPDGLTQDIGRTEGWTFGIF